MRGTERTILVTGAGRGIGEAIVRTLLQRSGITVIAASRNLEAWKDEAHSNAALELCEVDLLAEDAVQRVLERLGGRRLHGLVHNAGALRVTAMGSHRRADMEHVFATNVFVPLELSQALAPNLMGEPPGHIVHIGSMGGFQDAAKFPGLVAYSSSKAALACMAQCLAEEFSDRGIRSNCLALGAVDTAMLREAFPAYTAPISAEDMGRYVADFCLEGHKYFNGRVLPVAMSTP